MECWYDSLFECDCKGIYELMKVPCGGTWDTHSLYVNPSGWIASLPGPMIPKLQKRISWIIRCGNIAAFDLIGFDDWKSNQWKYFIEAYKIRVWYESEGQWFWTLQELNPHSCYYLGRYPWRWDFDYFYPRTPTGGGAMIAAPPGIPTYEIPTPPKPPPTPNIQPFAFAPVHPDDPYNLILTYTEEEIKTFHYENISLNYKQQLRFIEARKAAFTSCKLRNYPPPEKKGKREISTPYGPAEWPGKPMEQLTLPTPQTLPPPAPGIPYTKETLKITYGFSPPDRPEGLTIDIEYY